MFTCRYVWTVSDRSQPSPRHSFNPDDEEEEEEEEDGAANPSSASCSVVLPGRWSLWPLEKRLKLVWPFDDGKATTTTWTKARRELDGNDDDDDDDDDELREGWCRCRLLPSTLTPSVVTMTLLLRAPPSSAVTMHCSSLPALSKYSSIS